MRPYLLAFVAPSQDHPWRPLRDSSHPGTVQRQLELDATVSTAIAAGSRRHDPEHSLTARPQARFPSFTRLALYIR
jgi:hypothetical protein